MGIMSISICLEDPNALILKQFGSSLEITLKKKEAYISNFGWDPQKRVQVNVPSVVTCNHPKRIVNTFLDVIGDKGLMGCGWCHHA